MLTRAFSAQIQNFDVKNMFPCNVCQQCMHNEQNYATSVDAKIYNINIML